MKSWFHAAAACLWSCLAAGAQAAPISVPEEPALARLRAGEIITENSLSDESGAAVSIMAFMYAPPERIWEIIISCRYVHAFVSGLELCAVLEERGDHALTRQVVDKGWMMPRMDFTFETSREPYRHMEFRLTEGNLKAMQGSWDFATYPDGVLVRHELVLKPLLPAPRWLVRRNLKKDLPGMLRCIRGLAAGGGSGQQTGEDLEQCPGKVQDQ